MRTRLILTTTALLLAVTACNTSSPEHTPASLHTTTTVAPTPTPAADDTTEPTPELSPDDITELIVDLTWDQTSQADRKAMCDGITLFGPEWAADQMRDGAGDESVDWERAAVLIEAKCADR